MKKYTKEEVYQIRKGHMVVVTRTTDMKDWDEIKDIMHRANQDEEHDGIEHLVQRGMFVRRNDDTITIDIEDEGEKSFPIRSVLISVPTDFLERDEYGNHDEEEDEGN